MLAKVMAIALALITLAIIALIAVQIPTHHVGILDLAAFDAFVIFTLAKIVPAAFRPTEV